MPFRRLSTVFSRLIRATTITDSLRRSDVTYEYNSAAPSPDQHSCSVHVPSHLTFYVFQKQENPAGYIVVVALEKCVSGDQVVSLAVKHIVKAVPEKQNFVHYRGSSGALKELTLVSEDSNKFDKHK